MTGEPHVAAAHPILRPIDVPVDIQARTNELRDELKKRKEEHAILEQKAANQSNWAEMILARFREKQTSGGSNQSKNGPRKTPTTQTARGKYRQPTMDILNERKESIRTPSGAPPPPPSSRSVSIMTSSAGPSASLVGGGNSSTSPIQQIPTDFAKKQSVLDPAPPPISRVNNFWQSLKDAVSGPTSIATSGHLCTVSCEGHEPLVINEGFFKSFIAVWKSLKGDSIPNVTVKLFEEPGKPKTDNPNNGTNVSMSLVKEVAPVQQWDVASYKQSASKKTDGLEVGNSNKGDVVLARVSKLEEVMQQQHLQSSSRRHSSFPTKPSQYSKLGAELKAGTADRLSKLEENMTSTHNKLQRTTSARANQQIQKDSRSKHSMSALERITALEDSLLGEGVEKNHFDVTPIALSKSDINNNNDEVLERLSRLEASMVPNMQSMSPQTADIESVVLEKLTNLEMSVQHMASDKRAGSSSGQNSSSASVLHRRRFGQELVNRISKIENNIQEKNHRDSFSSPPEDIENRINAIERSILTERGQRKENIHPMVADIFQTEASDRIDKLEKILIHEQQARLSLESEMARVKQSQPRQANPAVEALRVQLAEAQSRALFAERELAVLQKTEEQIRPLQNSTAGDVRNVPNIQVGVQDVLSQLFGLVEQNKSLPLPTTSTGTDLLRTNEKLQLSQRVPLQFQRVSPPRQQPTSADAISPQQGLCISDNDFPPLQQGHGFSPERKPSLHETVPNNNVAEYNDPNYYTNEHQVNFLHGDAIPTGVTTFAAEFELPQSGTPRAGQTLLNEVNTPPSHAHGGAFTTPQQAVGGYLNNTPPAYTTGGGLQQVGLPQQLAASSLPTNQTAHYRGFATPQKLSSLAAGATNGVLPAAVSDVRSGPINDFIPTTSVSNGGYYVNCHPASVETNRVSPNRARYVVPAENLQQINPGAILSVPLEEVITSDRPPRALSPPRPVISHSLEMPPPLRSLSEQQLAQQLQQPQQNNSDSEVFHFIFESLLENINNVSFK